MSEEKDFKEIAVSWGYCEVQADKVVVLAESAETKTALDEEKVRETLESILRELENVHLSPEEIRKLRQEEQKQKTFFIFDRKVKKGQSIFFNSFNTEFKLFSFR